MQKKLEYPPWELVGIPQVKDWNFESSGFHSCVLIRSSMVHMYIVQLIIPHCVPLVPLQVSHSLIYLYIDAYTVCIFSICLDTISPCETFVAYIVKCMDPDQTASVIKLV